MDSTGCWQRANNRWTPVAEPDPYEGMDKVFAGQKAIDVLGQEVFVGDRIAVAVTVSRSANMRVGTVVALEEIQEEDWKSYHENGGKITKKGSGKFRIKCEWEASGWDQSVKASSIQAELPKYVKL